MVITCKSRKHKRCKRRKSPYDLGYFDFEQREPATKLLEPLGLSKNQPLIWTEYALVLEVRLSGPVSAGAISNHVVLLASPDNT